MSAASPAITAMADATFAATQFSRRLYPENAVCNDAEQVSEAVRRALHETGEDFGVGHTYVVIASNGVAVPVAPDVRRAAVDALIRVRAPRLAACDTCSRGLAPVDGLLPVGAGAVVVVLALCEPCLTFLSRDAFPAASFLTNPEN